jgi:hypothetical protein
MLVGQAAEGFHPVDRIDLPINDDGDDKIQVSAATMNLPMTSLAPSAVVIVVLGGIVMWQRKRQFDMKGYHKKRESDLPDC